MEGITWVWETAEGGMYRMAPSSRPGMDRANRFQCSVADGVGLAARIGPTLQYPALRMSDDHAIQAGALEPIRQPIDVMPTL